MAGYPTRALTKRLMLSAFRKLLVMGETSIPLFTSVAERTVGRVLTVPLKVATASKSAAKAPEGKVRKTAHIDHA